MTEWEGALHQIRATLHAALDKITSRRDRLDRALRNRRKEADSLILHRRRGLACVRGAASFAALPPFFSRRDQ